MAAFLLSAQDRGTFSREIAACLVDFNGVESAFTCLGETPAALIDNQVAIEQAAQEGAGGVTRGSPVVPNHSHGAGLCRGDDRGGGHGYSP